MCPILTGEANANDEEQCQQAKRRDLQVRLPPQRGKVREDIERYRGRCMHEKWLQFP